ncbi:MAG: hypothetical protein ACK4Q5_05425 [Saprospiraceae bacterium]
MNSNSNDLFDMLFRLVLKNAFNPQKTGKDDNRAENELMLAALGLLAFVGADATKVVYRDNFGKDGFSMLRVVLSFLAFCLVAGIGFHFSGEETNIDPKYGRHTTYLMAGIFYTVLAFYVLGKGIMAKKAANVSGIHPEYRGDSRLLSFLMTEKGWSQSNVQTWAEPLLTLAVGGLLAAINLLWGLPIVFCAFSIWGYMVVEYLFAANPVSDRMQQHGYPSHRDDFTQMRY